MDAVYTQSFGNQVFPNAAATGASLWQYAERHDAALNLPTRFNAHNDRLIARGVVACPTGKYCDWGSKDGVPYDNHPTAPNLRATIINRTPFKIQVKSRPPCASQTGVSLASLLPGERYVAEVDFIVTAKGAVVSRVPVPGSLSLCLCLSLALSLSLSLSLTCPDPFRVTLGTCGLEMARGKTSSSR